MANLLGRAPTVPALFAIFALTACSGGLPASAPAIPALASIGSAAVTSVVVTVQRQATPLSGVPVDLYTGKESTNCPGFPPNFTCIVRVKGLAHGTTAKNGKVTLKAAFSSSELVCAQADYSGGWVQKCARSFPTSVLLQVK